MVLPINPLHDGMIWYTLELAHILRWLGCVFRGVELPSEHRGAIPALPPTRPGRHRTSRPQG